MTFSRGNIPPKKGRTLINGEWIESNPKIVLSCSFCSKPIERYKKEVKKNTFCNRDCMSKWMSINNCGKNNPAFGTKRPYVAERNRQRTGISYTNEGSFKKDNTPWNKGKTGYMGANKSSFKPGQVPWNKGITGEKSHSFGLKFSEERLKNLSIAQTGKKHTQETKKKLSELNIGRKMSAETRAKMSASQTGHKPYYFGPSPFKGRKHTEKAKIMNSQKHIAALTPEKILQLKKQRWAQKFPQQDTKPERILQKALIDNGIKFTSHYRVIDGVFSHEADTFIDGTKILVNADGEFWHTLLLRGKKKKTLHLRDYQIDAKLESLGYIVLRFWQYDLEHNLKWCMSLVRAAIKRANNSSNSG